MKLISKFKDYYDYLIGKYGIDEKCIYNRTTEVKSCWGSYKKEGYNPDFHLSAYRYWQVHFCGNVYHGHYYNGNIYYGLDAEVIPSIIKSQSLKYYNWMSYNKRGRIVDNPKLPAAITNGTLNEKHDCPVIISIGADEIKNPNLSLFKFSKVVPPDEAYTAISNFLLRDKEIADNQSNKEKIVSNGFDLVTSFRKM